MKKYLLGAILSLLCFNALTQKITPTPKDSKKGKVFFSWGWNRANYSKSNIHFAGTDYDFTLKKTVAKDKPLDFSIDGYLNIKNITIPQYNYRIGVFLNDKYSISYGFDHMKYVVVNDQVTKIDGEIHLPGSSFNGSYHDDDIVISKNFLLLEHTDGLNYINFELRRNDKIFAHKKIQIDFIEGIGAGTMMPRTDATLLGKKRHDKFHFAGYGLAALIGTRVQMGRNFFLQSDFKIGYSNLYNIRTTEYHADKADQDFFFYQLNFGLGFQTDFFSKIF